jgi:hypothetical protein
MFAPFAVLCGVCAVYPRPQWTRRVDWLRVSVLLYCLGVWAAIIWAVFG